MLQSTGRVGRSLTFSQRLKAAQRKATEQPDPNSAERVAKIKQRAAEKRAARNARVAENMRRSIAGSIPARRVVERIENSSTVASGRTLGMSKEPEVAFNTPL